MLVLAVDAALDQHVGAWLGSSKQVVERSRSRSRSRGRSAAAAPVVFILLFPLGSHCCV